MVTDERLRRGQVAGVRDRVVLVVSDDAGIGEFLQMVLESALDLQVAVAQNVEGALATAVQTRTDLVLLDVRPPAFSSLEVARHLRAYPATRNIPVLALVFWDEGRAEAVAAGCDAILDRPFDDIDRLIARVRDRLNHHN